MATELDKIELPYGKTKEYVKSVVEAWDEYHLQLENGKKYSCNPSDYDDFSEDEEYIDRYFYDVEIGDCCFCVSTEKCSGTTWLSEEIAIHYEDGAYDYFYINELRNML